MSVSGLRSLLTSHRPSCSPSFSHPRSFYTFHPQTAGKKPCLVLPDGSSLIARPGALKNVASKALSGLDESSLPPRVHPVRVSGQRDQLSKDEILEATLLRREDPTTWTVKALAEKFCVDREYIKLRIPVSREYRMMLNQVQDNEFEQMDWIKKRRILTRLRRRQTLW